MKKLSFLIVPMFVLFLSCSSDDDQPQTQPVVTQSFKLDNNTFSLLSANGIVELRDQNGTTVDGITYKRSTVTLHGMLGFSKMANITFDLYYKESESIAGTYMIHDDNDSPENFEGFLDTNGRGCMGWTSMGVIFSMNGSGDIDSNNPTGTVKIIANSPNNYTVQYNGNFRLYDDSFNFVRNVPSITNVTGNVTLQEN